MKIHFEPATRADLQTVMEIHTRAFAPESKEMGALLPGSDDLKWHRYMLKHHHYFKILADEKIVGTIVVEDHGEGEYLLNTLCVDPKYQKRGIGKQAMAFIETHFADAKKWSLNVTERNERNQKFYEALGYEKRGMVFYIDPKNIEAWNPLFFYEKEMGRKKSKPRARRVKKTSAK